MPQADVGILDRGRRLAAAPVAAPVARDQRAQHRLDVLVGAAEPVLHRQEPGTQVLRLAGHEAQQLRQPAQRLHLSSARGRLSAAAAAQLLHQLHDARGGLGHVQIAHARQLHDGAVGDQPDHRVAMRAPRLQRRADRLHMLLEKQQVRDHDVALRHRVLRGAQGLGVLAPFGGGVDLDREAGELGAHPGGGAGGGAGGVLVQRDDHDTIGDRLHGRRVQHGCVIEHNAPSPRRAFPR